MIRFTSAAPNAARLHRRCVPEETTLALAFKRAIERAKARKPEDAES